MRKNRRRVVYGLMGIGLVGLILSMPFELSAQDNQMLIDDFSKKNFISAVGTSWVAVTDKVMGGISEVKIETTIVNQRRCLHLTGNVRVENNGGFIQAALNLSKDNKLFDASLFSGIRLTVYGNNENYSIHLRTLDNYRPWQSYRAHFVAKSMWHVIELPFESFKPYRLETKLDTKRLKRIGLVAIGRPFRPDLAVSNIEFYR